MSKVSMKEKIRTYEKLLHNIHFERAEALDPIRTLKLLDNISAWSFAHKGCNGTQSEQETERSIEFHFRNLNNLDI